MPNSTSFEKSWHELNRRPFRWFAAAVTKVRQRSKYHINPSTSTSTNTSTVNASAWENGPLTNPIEIGVIGRFDVEKSIQLQKRNKKAPWLFAHFRSF